MLVLTLASIDEPAPGDLDEKVDHIAIDESYTLRIALTAEGHALSVGLIHSHPQSCAPRPSIIDDDMDTYYGGYFESFAPSRPYISLIVSKVDGELAISGRVLWQGQWMQIGRFAIERTPIRTWVGGARPKPEEGWRERTARLNAAFGIQAASRLRRATVAIIGAGGTGSAAIEMLARAGIGRLIVVDPDFVDESNLERIHGSRPEHARRKVPKTIVARDHILSIDPECQVHAFIGALPQKEILDAIIGADVVLGCTDQQHSRLALSDAALRYLVPGFDCGVLLEGEDGRVTGQVVQIIRFLAADPCALCRNLTTPTRLSRELISDKERTQRRMAAAAARKRGEDPDPYWRDDPQLNTTGYLTTTAGAMAAGYVIGWLTGRFDAPFSRMQMNLAARFLDVTDAEQKPNHECTCRRVRGWADQAAADAFITPPAHWAPVRIV